VRQGAYRIVYAIDEKQMAVLVVKIGHRRDVYKDS
jgi:mRNA-degrading endonuclease RelE of RelBE toxin-antitoxin system